MRVLLVEDDSLLGAGIRDSLVQDGYTVDWVQDGLDADNALKSEEFNLIVLDLNLPKRSGLTVLHHLRSRGDATPVLILTAYDSIDERVKGLDSGADDYLGKPFTISELCARLRALTRRVSNSVNPVLTHNDLALDPAAHIVFFRGKPVELSRREFALLHLLLQHEGHVLSKERLTQLLYGWEDEIGSNVLEVHVHNLRKRFGQAFIYTVRGIGYIIKKPEQIEDDPFN